METNSSWNLLKFLFLNKLIFKAKQLNTAANDEDEDQLDVKNDLKLEAWESTVDKEISRNHETNNLPSPDDRIDDFDESDNETDKIEVTSFKTEKSTHACDQCDYVSVRRAHVVRHALAIHGYFENGDNLKVTNKPKIAEQNPTEDDLKIKAGMNKVPLRRVMGSFF